MKRFTSMLRVSSTHCIAGFSLLFFILSGCNKEAPGEGVMDDVNETFTLADLGPAISLKSNKLDLGIVLGPVSLFTHDSLLFIASTGR